MFCLLFLLAQKVSDKPYGLSSNDERSGDRGFPTQDQTKSVVTTSLLVLVRIDVNNVVESFMAFVQREEDQFLGICVQLIGRLLYDRELLVDFGKGLVSKVIGFLEVWLEILIWARQVRQDGNSKGLIRRIAQLDRLLTVRICLECFDTIMNYGVAVDML